MKDKWVIAVISTYYDLVEERKAICEFIKDHGMICSAFEEPDFPVLEHVQSHENCIKALERADLAILLINKRYGGSYYLDNNISITEAEYNSLRIPKIVFINKQTWDERHQYKKCVERSGLTKEEFNSKSLFAPKYVDDLRVIYFIENIQDEYNRTNRSNWMLFWDNIDDLISQLPQTLASISASIFHKIIERQLEGVKRRKTSMGLSLSLGDVFERNCYVTQEYDVLSGDRTDDGQSLPDFINTKMDQGSSCRILGEAGIGKTTLLANAFLLKYNDVTDSPYHIPFFIWLKDLKKDFSFSFLDYFDYCCEIYLNKECYPFVSFDGFSFLFYLDGFDEMSESISSNQLDQLLSSDIFKCPLVLSSRTQYAERFMISNIFSSRFSFTFVLKEWTQESSQLYIKNFCKNTNVDDDLETRINVLLTQNSELQDILKTPLLITVLLYIVQNNRMQIPETLNSRLSLFNRCFEILATREIESKCSTMLQKPSVDDTILAWSLFAWCIYDARLNGLSSISINDGLNFVQSYSTFFPNIHFPKTIYDSIFDTNGNLAFGSFHEQFLEYLVSNALLFFSRNKVQPYPDFFRYVLRPEINRYFRAIFNQTPIDIKKKIVDSITELYLSIIGQDNSDCVLKRVHAVYHLSRLNFDNRTELINRLFKSEQNKAVLQSLFFGAIKSGDLIRENEYYNLLENDKDYSEANRGYHLAYYDGLNFLTTSPYSNDPSHNWSGTLSAFLRHFSCKDIGHFHLRRIELITMRQFILFRKSTAPLDESSLLKFEDYVFHPHHSIESFQKLIEEEFSRLKEAYRSIVKK